MSRDVSGNPMKFDLVQQGEGVGSTGSWLRHGTFTAAATDIVTVTAHGMSTGTEVRLEEGSNNDIPAGLAETTSYWVGRIDANTFYLYATRDAAMTTGTAVDVTDAGTTPNYLLMKPVFDIPLYVRSIVIDAGSTGGSFEVHDASSGRSLTGALSIAANAHEQIVIDDFVQGVYMTTMADGQILVYHGRPAHC